MGFRQNRECHNDAKYSALIVRIDVCKGRFNLWPLTEMTDDVLLLSKLYCINGFRLLKKKQKVLFKIFIIRVVDCFNDF